MNWLNLKVYLLLLFISFLCLTEAAKSSEESLAKEKAVDLKDLTNAGQNARKNDAPGLVDQIFSQPMIPSLTYNRGQSLGHNLGYNMGRTLGKTPFRGASLDPQAAASKVVLVLANDTPQTAAIPQPDEDTLKRLVRNPDFWEKFVGHMAAFNDHVTQSVPAISRTVGVGINEALSQAPIVGPAQEMGAIDFATFAQTVGEQMLPQNMFAGISDTLLSEAFKSNSTVGENEELPEPVSETERVENELSPDQGENMQGPDPGFLDNPLLRSFQKFVPPMPSAGAQNPFLFNTQPWSWFPPNGSPEGAASDISEVRVKPESQHPYKITPKEGASQKLNEMKLRAAMQDALNRKTIPILWFRLSEKADRLHSARSMDQTSVKSEEDMQMQSKLEEFEKQLIMELKQLQEVVKLANAMKKAQLETKEKKQEASQMMTPLTLNNTPIYKITLQDIEKTLKDEYVQKLLQMISNNQKKEQEHKALDASMKYINDGAANPNKRQTTMGGGSMADNLNKDDMMKMMSYAYRMAAANGQEMPWLKDDNIQSLEDPSKGTQSSTADQTQKPEQRAQQQADEQQWTMDKHEKMALEAEKERAEERTPGKHGHSKNGHSHGHSHGHFGHSHFGRQSDEPNMQMRQGGWLTNEGAHQAPPMQMRQGGWLTNEGAEQAPPNMQMRQGGWLTNEQAPPMQMRQGGWLTNEGAHQAPPMQMRQGGWLTNEGAEQAPPNMQMRQGGWLTNEQAPPMQMRQGGFLPNEGAQQAPPMQMRQGTWLTNEGAQQTPAMEMRQGGFLTNEGSQQAPPMQMRQGTWLTNEGAQQAPAMEMRQGGFLTNEGSQQAPKMEMRQGDFLTNEGEKQTEQKPREGSWLTNGGEQMPMPMQADPSSGGEPKMRQGAWLTDDPAKLQHQQQMENNHGVPPTLMAEQRSNTQMGPQQMSQMQRQGGWLTQDGKKQDSPMNMDEKQRQGAWLTTSDADKTSQQQQQQIESRQGIPIPGLTKAEQRHTIEGPEGQMQQFTASNDEAQRQQQPQMRQMNMGQPMDGMAAKSQQAQMDTQMPMRQTGMERQMNDQMANKDEQPQMQMTEKDVEKMHAIDSAGTERQAGQPNVMATGGEATPQMPENAGKARHKESDDFFDDFDLFGHHHGKKNKDKNKGTVINYYYNTGGSRYPTYGAGYGGGYAPQQSYGGGYAPQQSYGGGYAPQQSYGGGYAPQQSYGGGYGGGYAMSPPRYGGGGGYGAGGGYAKRPSGGYGGGGYGSNAYGSSSRGGYRTATGDDEIEEMLKEHQTMPKMMLLTIPDDNPFAVNGQPKTNIQNSKTARPITSLDAASALSEEIKNHTKSNQTSNASETSSVTENKSQPELPQSSSATTSQSSAPLLNQPPPPPSPSTGDSDPEASEQARSLFSFDSKILEPYMGLKKIDRKDDPWHHKPYNLYQPLFTGGGTYESLLNRYRRNASNNPSNNFSAQQKNVLTPGMLERLLRIKMNFEKNYPILYKTMMGHLMGDKHTTLSITPPEIPEQVSYPNVELAAAEINQLDSLIEQLKLEKYQQQQLLEQQQLQQQQQQQQSWSSAVSSQESQESHAPVGNFFNSEKSFWDEIQQHSTDDIPSHGNNFWQQYQDNLESTSSIRKRNSFWSELEAAEERRNQQRDRQIADDLDSIFNFDGHFD